MTIGVCVQFEGRFAEGAAALINSLYRWGFRGPVFVGVRGSRPPWLEVGASGQVAPGLNLVAMAVDHDEPLVWTKPRFVSGLWNGPAQDVDVLYYFDADVLLIGPWKIFESWAEGGVAVCADVNPEMPAGHPFRRVWRSLVDPEGELPVRPLETYYNAGFFGLTRKRRDWLDFWGGFNAVFRRDGAGRQASYPAGARHPSSAVDQDAFNAALMLSDIPIAPMGRDGMGFQAGGGNFVMAHAVGAPKPWDARLAAQALRRRRPSLAARAFVESLDGPLEVCGGARRRVRRLDLLAARAIGALIGS